LVNRERIVSAFLELVRIPSLTFYEKALVEYLAEELRVLGCEVSIDRTGEVIGGDSGNLIARLPGEPGKPAVMFAAHLDTVEPGTAIKPLARKDIIFSDGTTILGADDKAGIAAIMEMLRAVVEDKILHGDIEVVLTVAEEKGLLGAKNLDLSLLHARSGYVLDSNGTVGKVVGRAPSQNTIKVMFKGRSAHAGVCPEQGINAIQAASIAIAGMKLGRLDEETTANIGVIQGGRAGNIVPEEAKVTGEARSLNPDKLQNVTDEMVRCFQAGAKEVGAAVDIEVIREYDSFILTERDAVVRTALEAMRRLEIKPELVSTGGGSDTNVFNKKGISAVNLSVGAEDVHSTREHIAVDDLVMAARLLVETVKVVAGA
jgi:tripeptide aminopeptidase